MTIYNYGSNILGIVTVLVPIILTLWRNTYE